MLMDGWMDDIILPLPTSLFDSDLNIKINVIEFSIVVNTFTISVYTINNFLIIV